jgi:8-oxo-dGTP pyrophosphatase MutT (NUDIX family)
MAVRIVKTDLVPVGGQHDQEVVGADGLAGPGLMPEQPHLDRAHQDRPGRDRAAQPAQRGGRAGGAGPLGRPAEQAQRRVDTDVRIPAQRVEQRPPPAEQLHPEGRAGQHLDQSRVGAVAHDHGHAVRVAVGARAGVAEGHEPQSARPVAAGGGNSTLLGMLEDYRPETETEAADVARVRALLAAAPDPWLRSLPLHVTASAVIVHPDSGQVLLRWHQRQQAWLQVGGHGDPGESDPLAIAGREAAEETSLPDLVPWPDARIRHVVIVPVPAGAGEPAHEHADVRFVLATQAPGRARAEHPGAPLRWLPVAGAQAATSADSLKETLTRVARLLRPAS